MSEEQSGTTGWLDDPSGRHQERYFVDAQPTELVRDGGQQGIDPLSSTGPVPAPLLPPPAPGPTPGPEAIESSVWPAPTPASDSRLASSGHPGPSRSAKVLLIGAGVIILLIIAVAAVASRGKGAEDNLAATGMDSTSTTGDGGAAAARAFRATLTTSTTTTRPPTTTTTKALRSFDRTTYRELASDPDRFVGSSVDVVGKVFGTVETKGSTIALQMFADPKNSEWKTVVAATDPGFMIAADDYVRIKGVVMGAFDGTNAFGGSVSAVSVFASTIEKVDATATASPALRESLGGSINQHGLVVRVDKVQYAADETRVLVTVTNGSGTSASFSSYSAKAVRGSSQFEPESSYGSGYPTIPSEILPGVSASGVIVFPAMAPEGALTLVFSARNENYRLDFDDYSITAS